MYEIELILVLIIVLVIIAGYLIKKNLDIQEQRIDYNYRIAKRKLNQASRDDEDEIEDFGDSLPPWLSAVLQGANINLEGLYNQDPAELAKLKNIIDKIPSIAGQAANNSQSGSLIG